MPTSRPKKSLIGLALGVALTGSIRAEETGAANGAASFGDTLLAQLLYLPAGLLVAAVLLELIARSKTSKSLHGGVLALLASATIGAVAAV